MIVNAVNRYYIVGSIYNLSIKRNIRANCVCEFNLTSHSRIIVPAHKEKVFNRRCRQKFNYCALFIKLFFRQSNSVLVFLKSNRKTNLVIHGLCVAALRGFLGSCLLGSYFLGSCLLRGRFLDSCLFSVTFFGNSYVCSFTFSVTFLGDCHVCSFTLSYTFFGNGCICSFYRSAVILSSHLDNFCRSVVSLSGSISSFYRSTLIRRGGRFGSFNLAVLFNLSCYGTGFFNSSVRFRVFLFACAGGKPGKKHAYT